MSRFSFGFAYLIIAGVVILAMSQFLPIGSGNSDSQPTESQLAVELLAQFGTLPGVDVSTSTATIDLAPPADDATSITGPAEPPTTAPSRSTATEPPASEPPTSDEPTAVTSPGDYDNQRLSIHIAFESQVGDVTTDEFAATALAVLGEPTGWTQAGFDFVQTEATELRVVLAEPGDVDYLCQPLRTAGIYSCQSRATVAINADRWRNATTFWDGTLDDYRRYVINHEVGHLIGQFHPQPRCPNAGGQAAVMEPQTKGLEGCIGNAVPLQWEIEYASVRPVRIGPAPDYPNTTPVNQGG